MSARMMNGWLRHLELTVKSKTGLGAGVLVWGLIVVLGAAATVVFLVAAAFIALAERYGPLMAALALGGFFLLITVVAIGCCLASRRRTVAGAKLALEARSHAPWLDPRFLGVGVQIGRAIGWRRLVPLAAVGILAAGLAKEWFSHGRLE
jgi:type VI protein secretion system component VasK